MMILKNSGVYQFSKTPVVCVFFRTIGSTFSNAAAQYKVSSGSEVTYTADTTGKPTVSIPSTINVAGKTYKVTAIGDRAFKNNKKVKKIVIGKNVKTIGRGAFYGCKNLRKVKIYSSTIKKVGRSAFAKCGYKNGAKLVVDVPNKQIAKYTKLFRKRKLSLKAVVK